MPIQLLSPFAQRYLLEERWLPSSGGGECLSIKRDLNWHLSIKAPNLLALMELNRDKVGASNFELFSDDNSDCIARDQPTWDMNHWQDNLHGGDAVQDAPELAMGCSGWRMERLAYYVPAHSEGKERYGIHILKEGIEGVVRKVSENCASSIPPHILWLSACYFLYAHELCHAWIEDILCILDFANGERRAKSDRTYNKVNRKYHSYIFLEEAICNTSAYGALSHYLMNSVILDHDVAIDRDDLLAAYAQWMRTQPKGYRDFVTIDQRPNMNSLLLQNIIALLVKVYGVSLDNDVLEIVASYFGGRFVGSIDRYESGSGESFWSAKWPTHLHDIDGIKDETTRWITEVTAADLDPIAANIAIKLSDVKKVLSECFTVSGTVHLDRKRRVHLDGSCAVKPGITFSRLPLIFSCVTGDFDCSGAGLVTLDGSPEEVGGNFSCGGNMLRSLDGAPRRVGKDFNCQESGILTLDGHPDKIGGDLLCARNKIISLGSGPSPYQQLRGIKGRIQIEFARNLPLLRLVGSKVELLGLGGSGPMDFLNQYSGRVRQGVLYFVRQWEHPEFNRNW